MKYVMLFILFTQSTLSYSQFFVGESREFAKSVLQNKKIKFEESKLTDTTSRISWTIEGEYQEILVLDRNDIGTIQSIIPERDQVINELVKWLNKDFVIISDTEWRNYANGKIYKIQLSYLYENAIFTITE